MCERVQDGRDSSGDAASSALMSYLEQSMLSRSAVQAITGNTMGQFPRILWRRCSYPSDCRASRNY